MNKKKYFVAFIALNTVLLALAASFDHQRRTETQCGSNQSKKRALSGPSGKFGPVIETVLPSRTGSSVEILDLETGCARRQPSLDYFNSRADAIMGWIRSNRLDISSSLWPGRAACVTYDMTIVPAEATCWEQTTEEELLANPALAPVARSPRRLLVMEEARPNTYFFRTGEGTLGMLQLVGLSEHGVQIRYKLINPSKPDATLAASARNWGMDPIPTEHLPRL